MSLLDIVANAKAEVYCVEDQESGGLMKHVITKSLDASFTLMPEAGAVAGPLLCHGDSRVGIFRLAPLGRLGPIQNGAYSIHIFILEGAKTLATAAAIQIGERYISRFTHDMTIVVRPHEIYALKNCNVQSHVDIAILEAAAVPCVRRSNSKSNEQPSNRASSVVGTGAAGGGVRRRTTRD